MSQNNNYIEVIRKRLIKHFTFQYNSAYRVYKDAKYSIGQWPQKLKLDYAKAILKLDNKQDRIYYGIDIYSNIIVLGLVIHPIKKINKVINNNKMS